MEGPFQLADNVIDAVVAETDPAVYLIRRIEETGAYAHYKARVERAVNGAIKDELKRWVDTDYSVFCFEYVEDDLAAFYRHCILWHDMGGAAKKLDNERHPELHDKSTILCPICSDVPDDTFST